MKRREAEGPVLLEVAIGANGYVVVSESKDKRWLVDAKERDVGVSAKGVDAVVPLLVVEGGVAVIGVGGRSVWPSVGRNPCLCGVKTGHPLLSVRG